MTKARDLELTAKIVQKASVGKTKKRIAEELNISTTTVQRHLQALRKELDHRIENEEDPFEAWGAILTGILLGAGIGGVAALISDLLMSETREEALYALKGSKKK